MAMSVSIVAVVTALHLIAFVFAVGAERRRSTVLFTHSILYIHIFFWKIIFVFLWVADILGVFVFEG